MLKQTQKIFRWKLFCSLSLQLLLLTSLPDFHSLPASLFTQWKLLQNLLISYLCAMQDEIRSYCKRRKVFFISTSLLCAKCQLHGMRVLKKFSLLVRRDNKRSIEFYARSIHTYTCIAIVFTAFHTKRDSNLIFPSFSFRGADEIFSFRPHQLVLSI